MSITWSGLNDRLIMQAKEKRVPISGQFELTARCNLQCKMCYICRLANDREAMIREHSAREWIQLAEEARDAGMLSLLLTGGEVFLRQDFLDIYNEISMMGFNTKIYTNATLITPEIAQWLGRIPPSMVEVTMYGASSQNYGAVCGDINGFERAVRGIDLLLSEGIALRLRTTVVRSNIGDFDRLMEFSEKRGVPFGIVNYVTPRREGCNSFPEKERLSPLELAKYENYIDSYHSNEEKNNKKLIKELQHQDVDDPLFCTAGKCSFWVTWDGKMVLCGEVNDPASQPFKKGFDTAWKELQGICSSIPQCMECKRCALRTYCIACPARLKSETGFYDKPAPYLCELAQKRKELGEKRQMKTNTNEMF